MKTIRKLLLSLTCVLALGLGSSLAQQNIYAGGSTGIDIFLGGRTSTSTATWALKTLSQKGWTFAPT